MEKINLYPFITDYQSQEVNFHDGELAFIEELATYVFDLLIDPTATKRSTKDREKTVLTWHRMMFDDTDFYNILITYDDTDSLRLADVGNLPKITPEKLTEDFVEYFDGLLKLKGIQNIEVDHDSTNINPGFDNSEMITKAQIALRVNLPQNDKKDELTKEADK